MNNEKNKVACSNCNLRKLCLPSGLSSQELNRIDEVILVRRRLKPHETLFHIGDDFSSLYAIRSGFFKTSTAIEEGREQVTGFQIPGEIVGLDGIMDEHHTSTAVALKDAEVCVLPLDRITGLSSLVKGLQHHFHRIMAGEIVQDQGVMLMLGSMQAEERVAAFLVNRAGRLHARGFSRTELNLPMTREAIGSYLGMKIETVSRIFTRLVEQGMVKVNRRHVHILDPVALIRRVGQFEAVPAMALLSWSKGVPGSVLDE